MADALYVYLVPQPARVFTTESLTDRIGLDFSRIGKLLRIEVLFARETVGRGELGKLDEVLEPAEVRAVKAAAERAFATPHALS